MSDWDPFEEKPQPESVRVFGVDLRKGDRVRLWPQKTADIMDMALVGGTAVIEAIEQDFDDRIHFAVVVEDDPGREFGELRQPGHRFFFLPKRWNPLLSTGKCPLKRPAKDRNEASYRRTDPRRRNRKYFSRRRCFWRRGRAAAFPEGIAEAVRVVDFGIRGLDLAYALMDGYGATILVDATPRGGAPGAIYTIEPDLQSMRISETSVVDGHSMNPMNVFALVKSMGGEFKRILIVGCEPGPLLEEEGRMGLSAPVAAAVDEAIVVIESLVTNILSGGFRESASRTQALS